MTAKGAWGSWANLVVLTACWGSTFLWIDLALDEGVSAVHLTFGRAVIASAVLLVVARPRWHEWGPAGRPRPVDLLLAAALCNALPFLLVSAGQRTVTSGFAGVLNATTPLWTVLIALAAQGAQTLARRQIAGIGIGFGGVCLVVAPWQAGITVTAGVPLILLAAAGYAAGFVLMTRRLIPTAARPLELAALQMSASAILLAVPVAFTDPPRATRVGLLAVVVLGVFCTALTFAVVYQMLAAEGATRTSVVGYLIPVVAVVLGVLFRDERVGPVGMVGIAVVLVGVGLARSRPARPGGSEGPRTEKGQNSARFPPGARG